MFKKFLNLNFYSDRVNPVVVKELYQELRGKFFTILFVFSQLFLVLSLLNELIMADSSSYRNVGDQYQVVLGLICGLFFIIFVPIRALNSFSADSQNNALELIHMTNITAWQLVFGKWQSNILIAVLFFLLILPYFFVLYLISSLNVSNFFAYLYNCFNILCLIVALFVSTSAARKGKSLFLFLFLLPLIIGSVASFLASNIQDLSSWLLFFYTTLLTAISVPIMLLGGVVKAAKAQENYLPLKNILFLVLLLTTVGLFFVDLKIQIILIYYYSLILSPLLFSYLIEDVHPIADKKLREGQSGMVLLKYSGWPGGLFYFFIFSFVSFLIFFFSINYPTTGIKGQIIAYIYTVASLFSPMPFYWLFVNNKRGFSPIFYIIFQSIMVFLSTSFGYFESIGVIENYIFPQVELINLITESKTDFNDLNPFPLISCFILFYITILAVRRLIRSYRVSSS